MGSTHDSVDCWSAHRSTAVRDAPGTRVARFNVGKLRYSEMEDKIASNVIRPNDDDESENDFAPSAGLYRNMASADDIGLSTTELFSRLSIYYVHPN